MANVSKLLYTTTDIECFLNEIDPEVASIEQLLGAKTKIRNRIREAFKEKSEAHFGSKISPRFYTQGSYVYKTLNHPAFPPEQQMDLDDGCYLPLSFVKEERPSKAAAAFFEFVDGILIELADEEGWTFVEKPTCARLVISEDAHIDIPLYAIPDQEFVLLEKAMAQRTFTAASDQRPDSWDALPSNAVLLAHREDDWKVSDPRKIRKWFEQALEIHGEKLRRVCRYLKAWRDHNKDDLDKVSSILLMVCAFNAFEEVGRQNVPAREDEALLIVLERLSGYLSRKVENPTDRNEDVNRIPDEKRFTVCNKAREFAKRLRMTIQECNVARDAVDNIKASLGVRVPDRPDLVGVTAASIGKAAVHSQPKKEVAAPIVGRSTSG